MGRAFEYRKAAKMKRWGKMSTLFPKLSKAITIAAKEGGTDPDMNSKLRTAIINAKAGNMPKDNIDRAIKRAEGKDAADYTEVVYEGKGPHGVMVILECATDNTTRTVANVKYYFNKYGGGMTTSGSFDFLFDRKAVFEIEKTEEMNLEELEFELIDFGLEDIETDDEENIIIVYGEYTNFGSLSKALEDKGIEPKKATLERFPTSPVEFTDEQKEEIDKFLDKIDEDDDIQAVFTNMG
ncbi:MAG: YebC/PmpR family DNA-binding transcriptional regulator [Bacteroidales bacterium]|nr:YebC/PmpR family DNA-binding transcriptional regulator [Bacteroidales bacterium]